MTCTAPAAAFAYERLAADVTALIESGTLRPGERLPSVRRMSAKRRVSVPTVLQAYQLLEARRVIAARPRSGFYVLPRREGHASPRDHASGTNGGRRVTLLFRDAAGDRRARLARAGDPHGPVDGDVGRRARG